MRKKVFALALAAALTVGSTVPAFASAEGNTTVTPIPTTSATSGKLSSPEKKETITPIPTVTKRPTITSRPRPTITPSRTSPKTGQTDYVLYGMLGAVAFGSVVVVSKKKNNEDA